MQRVKGSIRSRCKDDWQLFLLFDFLSMWVHVWAAGSKRIVSSVQAWFRIDSGMNLIKQKEIITGRRCVWLFGSAV